MTRLFRTVERAGRLMISVARPFQPAGPRVVSAFKSRLDCRLCALDSARHGLSVRGLPRGLALLLFAAGALFSQPNSPNPPRGDAPPPPAAKAPGAGQRLVNPASPAARLMLATPEERERALAKFPPQRQEQIRKQLAWFDALPKEQQQLQIRRMERFAALPPAKQLTVRRQMQALNQLPPERRQAIRRALMLLQNTPAERRATRMASPAFRSRFTTEELQIIADLSEAWLLPPM